jgi:light-regulated signal transduction histidine kinase (bacteriophytochrome)
MNDIAWAFFSVFMWVVGYGFGVLISRSANDFLTETQATPTINDIMKWIAEDKENSVNQTDAIPQQTKENK